MHNALATFSSFSVDNLQKAKDFYVTVLGLKLLDETMGLSIELPKGGRLHIYEKPDHAAATFTLLNFVVQDIDQAVQDLTAKGISFEKYDLGQGPKQDEKGIMRGLSANMGPDIAWFADPAGNILSVLQDRK